MKILHVQVLPKMSGAQKVSYEILKKLPESYEKWILFSTSEAKGDREACIKAFEEIGVKVVFMESLRREIGPWDVKAFKELYKFFKKEKFDIVHTNSTKPGIIGRIAAKLSGVPLVVHTVHGLAFHKLIKFPLWQFYYLCEFFSSFFCHKIVVVNKFYVKYLKFFKKKTITIYNGLEFGQIKDSTPDYQKKRVLFVGRLDTPKNPIMLLQAAKIVHSIDPEVKFTLVGDGDLMKDCKNFVKENNQEGYVELAGWQTDVYKYYNSHSLFACPSVYEAFGLMFCEASYSKLPIVTTNVEGIPEVVKHGETGLLSDSGDVKTFAENILKLTSNPELSKELGENGFKWVMSQFDSSKMVNDYIKLYEGK